MKSHWFKALCLAVTMLIFTSSLLIGCTGVAPSATATIAPTADTTAIAATTAEQTTEPAKGPEWLLDVTPITLSVFIDSPSGEVVWGDDPVTKEITRRTGITCDIRVATTADSQQLNTMMASGELTDFIVLPGNTPARTSLIKQQYVQPLNKLIDQYCPAMWQILPKGQAEIFAEADGNLYNIGSWYCDVERLANLKGANITDGMFSLNRPMYEAAGSPALKTLDDYTALLKQIKEKNPDLPFLAYDGNIASVQNNMVQLINRIYGGTDSKAIAADGSVHLNFQDESYLKAIKYVNLLYREGLFNAENFTVKGEQFNELGKNQKIFSYWGLCFSIFQFDMSKEGPYDPTEPPQEPGTKLGLKNVSASIGSGGGVMISTSCKTPDRAIRYMEFMNSDEGQVLMGYGLEGKDYTIEEGALKYSEADMALLNSDWAKYVKETGAYNFGVAWIISRYTDCMAYYWLNKSNTKYNLVNQIYNKFAVNERLNEVIQLDNDSKEKVIEAKIFDLWQQSMPKMILAETEDACIQAHANFVDEAKKQGLEELQAAYTTICKSWQVKLK